jgi:hypothetical protein
MFARTSVAVSPVKQRFPVNISYRTHPKAQTSARRSTFLPRACSGLMYAAVPNTVPTRVTAAVLVSELETASSTAVCPA